MKSESNDKFELFQVFTRRYGLLSRNCCDPEPDCCSPARSQWHTSLVQSQILSEIRRQHNPSMQQMAATLGMDITTFSRQVSGLINKGWIAKTPHPGDRRVHILSLTPAGEEEERRIKEQMNDYLNEIFSFLSEEEQETVIRAIELLNQAMLKSTKCCLPPF